MPRPGRYVYILIHPFFFLFTFALSLFFRMSFSPLDLFEWNLNKMGANHNQPAQNEQPYEERAAKDSARYLEEYTTVYGTLPPSAARKAA
jgi:hypothetical protein